MTEYSLDPAFMVVDYHTANAPHKMTLPTLEWLPTNITGTIGSFVAWDGSTCDAKEMVDALCDALRPFVPSSTHFDQVTVYTQAAPTGAAIPRRSDTLTQVGTSVAAGVSAAISTTFNFKTLGNSNSRLVLLDTPLGLGGFSPIHPDGFSADVLTLRDVWTAVIWAWAGRDNTRPAVLRKITFDLNDRLQKAYRLT